MSLTAIRQQFRQMNGEVIALVYAEPGREGEARDALAKLVSFFGVVEARFSRFIPESELSALNSAAGTWFRASTALYQVCELALGYAEATQGRFDPTILRALESAGYDRSFEQVRDRNDTPKVVDPVATFRDVRLDRAGGAICLPTGVGLDLGGIVKGWAVDQGSRHLRAFADGAISAGGDMLVWGAPPGRAYWLVGVENPAKPEVDLLQLQVRDAAVATSGVRRRTWMRNGERQHHLIDPARQEPAHSDLVAVSVVAPTAVEADVQAKVAFLQGLRRGSAYLETRPDLAGVLVSTDGSTRITSRLDGLVEWPDSI